ncbi:MAG: TonB-dependent receptor family protein [Polyangiaceae bacterium]
MLATPIGKTAGSAHVIRERDLERYEYDDPHAVLTRVPGVYSRGEDGLGLRPNIGMRGVNPDRSKKLTLLEDGIPFGPAPYSAPAAYFFPLMTRMTYVRVIKGPAAIAYGPQSIGGAIDLITRPIPTETKGAADISLGEYGYRKAHGYFGSSDGTTGFLIEGVHLGNDGFKELPSGADTGFVKNEWMAKASYVPNPTARAPHSFGLKLSYADEISNETYLGLSDDDFGRTPLMRYSASQLDRMEWHRTSAALTHEISPLPNLKVTTQVYRHDFSRVWRKVNRFRGASIASILETPDSPQNAIFYAILQGKAETTSPGETLLIGPNQRRFVSQGVDVRVGWDTSTGGLAHRLEYGVTAHYDRIERRHSEDGFLVAGGELVPDGTPTVVTALNEASSYAAALHLSDAMSIGRFIVTPGVRTESIAGRFVDNLSGEEQGNSLVVVLPSLGAFWSLTDHFGVLAGAYRGFSPPAPGSAEYVDPELSINYEAGARYAKGRTLLEAVGFYNDYSNLTDVCTFSSGCLNDDLDRQFDAGEARIFGLESTAQHELQLPGSFKAPLAAAYTLTFSEFESSFESDDPIFGSVTQGDEVPYVPRHQLHLEAGLEHSRAGGSLAFNYVAATREVAGSEPLNDSLATDPQAWLDAAAFIHLTPGIKLYTNVRNLTNAHFIVGHRPYGARPNAPRWVQVGLKADL